MNQFELSLEEEINVYMNSGLTPTELFILRLLFLAIDGEPKYLVNYLSNTTDSKLLFRKVLESLKEKKVILASFKVPKEGESLNYNNIPISKNFIKMYVRESHELGKELFEEYPPFININGKNCSIKNITKAGLYSIEEFCIFYSKAIKNAGITHERVMNALRYGRENNLIFYSILEFVASRKWTEIEQIQQSGNINGYNNSELL